MPMRDKAGDPLDALIDDTARAMMEGASSIDVRTAVRARIGQTPARWRLAVGHAVAATCAAALVLVTLLVVGSVPAPVEDGGGAQAAREPVGATPVAAP